MREATFFTFDNISSEDMGVQVASLSSGLYEETFLPNRRIEETVVRGRSRPYFQGVESEPLSFPLTIFIYDWENRNNLRQIARWLYKDYYKPLYFDTNPERIYYAMIEGSSTLFHNGLKQGYITLNVRCSSPYTYSPVQYVGEINSLSTGALSIFNEGDLPIKTKLRIKKINGDGSIAIKNNTSEEHLIIESLLDEEELFIDCYNEEIDSSQEYNNVYRYNNHNGEWISFDIGDNILQFSGDFTVSIEYEMIYLADS